jgi:hypothetical protein
LVFIVLSWGRGIILTMSWPKVFMAVFLLVGWIAILPARSLAVSPSISPTQLTQLDDDAMATLSGEATESAETATSAARSVVQEVVGARPDITQPEGEVKGRLRGYLDEQEVGPLSITNFLQHAIRAAVSGGVPANTIVLILLFPVVTAIIAASRHLIGLRGFGLFVPAILSVAFVATGVAAGIFLFLVILGVATLGRNLVKRFHLQYLPRMALLLWFVSLGVFVVLLLAPVLRFEALAKVDIFSILILMLLAENFIEVQYGKSQREAQELTMETIVLALISSLVLSLEFMQRFALLNPEMLILMVAGFDLFMGRYAGLRYVEYQKFKKMLKD